MTLKVSGVFEVKITPQPADERPEAAFLGRMELDKTFHGELDATSKGQMLAVQTGVKGSAGYVALEQVSGELAGRAGTFILQHSGIMNRGTPQLALVVVPDSGTGELAGLTGCMHIVVADGKHLYQFEYSIAT